MKNITDPFVCTDVPDSVNPKNSILELGDATVSPIILNSLNSEDSLALPTDSPVSPETSALLNTEETPAIPNLLTPDEVAPILGVTTKWLGYKRWAGGGPPFKKIAGKVRYPEPAVIDYYNSLELQNNTTKKKSGVQGGQ